MEKDLSTLTERQKTAYLLREQGLTLKQIGEKMGVSKNAAWEHVHAAGKRLRALAPEEQRGEPL
ncbi:MAG: sigma factor-like helix-turn-helix DNA-binding protein [Eubacteriales bacterium]|nr:sigma factor-like helix-turn-helix DNA-binding protein [Eubacteriales bacterium]